MPQLALIKQHQKPESLKPSENNDSSSEYEEEVTKAAKIKKKNQTKKQKQKAKKKAARKATQATAESYDDGTWDDENELGAVHNQQLSKDNKRGPATNLQKIAKMLKTLENAASFVSRIHNPSDLEPLLEEFDLEDPHKLTRIEDNLRTVADAIRARRTHAEEIDASQYKVLRDGAGFQLLKIEDCFACIGSIEAHKEKTFGCIRQKGLNSILKFAISGKKKRLMDDPKLLDSEQWTKISLEFGKSHGLELQTNGYEMRHGHDKKGMAFASHVERQLMLWFSCDMLCRHIREHRTKSFDQQVLNLWRLRPLQLNVTAEIMLTRSPCNTCKIFQEMVQEVTGINFIFTVIDMVGKVELVTNKHNHVWFPIKSSEFMQAVEEDLDEDLDEDSDEEDESTPIKATMKLGSKCQVVIPVRAKTPTVEKPQKTHHHSRKQPDVARADTRHSELRREQEQALQDVQPEQSVIRQHRPHHRHHKGRPDCENSIIEVPPQITIRDLQKFIFAPNSEGTKRQRTHNPAQSDDEEFAPQIQKSKHQRGLLTPPEKNKPFPKELHSKAEKAKRDRKKREREAETPFDLFCKTRKSKRPRVE